MSEARTSSGTVVGDCAPFAAVVEAAGRAVPCSADPESAQLAATINSNAVESTGERCLAILDSIDVRTGMS